MVSQGAAGMLNIADVAANCIARDKVLYDGHAVAGVAADNPHIAEEAVNLIKVEYELLPPVMDVRTAMADDAPVVQRRLSCPARYPAHREISAQCNAHATGKWRS